jgi:Na+(H+)/acetate symporter ActP
MNGIVKIPMQYFILMIGVLVFVFYMFNTAPVYFNKLAVEKLKTTAYKAQVEDLENEHAALELKKGTLLKSWNASHQDKTKVALKEISTRELAIRQSMMGLVKESGIPIEQSDTNYIFIRFVMDHMPRGLIGLLIAVIFLAAWGSIAATFNSLSSATLIDFHKIYINENPSPEEEFRLSRWYTLFWGVFCIVFAQFATNLGSLIEACGTDDTHAVGPIAKDLYYIGVGKGGLKSQYTTMTGNIRHGGTFARDVVDVRLAGVRNTIMQNCGTTSSNYAVHVGADSTSALHAINAGVSATAAG